MDQMIVGDIVQIVDKSDAWYPCLLIVSEVKDWGVLACTLIPRSNSENDIGHAYRRLNYDKITRVGFAAIHPV